MRILGIDYGSRHVGLAKGDDENKIALPYLSLENKGINNLINELKDLVEKEDIGMIVVGYPLNMKSEITKETKEVDRFISSLKSKLNIKVVKEDERLSSAVAKKLGGDIDEHQLAAKEILQGYLDKA